MSRVLIVEDADAIRLSVKSALQSQGHQVYDLASDEGFDAALSEFQPELVILDIMLPGKRDGFDLLAVVNEVSNAGVIMLTAKDDVKDRVRGLVQGADDYVIKPFATMELMARVEAFLRRSGAVGSTIDVGGYLIADNANLVKYGDVEINLTDTERRILAELARHLDRVVSKTQLLTAVWGYQGYDPNVVEVHISSLRRHLELHGPRVIHTIRSRGYRLSSPE